MRTFVAGMALASLFWPVAARADSDGYACMGRGYVAFETRFSQSPARHLLHIVQFSPARGIVRLPPIPLEDFEVHAMRCRPTIVDVEGWTDGYSVDISDPSRPVITSRPRIRDRNAAATFSVGAGARDTVIDLDGGAFPGEFQLVMARVFRRLAQGVERYTFTHLVRRDQGPALGRLLESVKVFEGVFLETGD